MTRIPVTMRVGLGALVFLASLAVGLPTPLCRGTVLAAVLPGVAPQQSPEIQLPKPQTDGKVSVERAIAMRRSVREFATTPLTPAEIGQLAWAAQGITDTAGIKRAAPSAGALYPMEIYFFTPEGMFHYLPKTHTLVKVADVDRRAALSDAALAQASIRQSPCVVVLTAVPERTRPRYKDRTPRYVAIEAGHIGQNVLLEAAALGLAAVPIGAFTDEKVAQVLQLKAGEEPMYIIAIGRTASRPGGAPALSHKP